MTRRNIPKYISAELETCSTGMRSYVEHLLRVLSEHEETLVEKHDYLRCTRCQYVYPPEQFTRDEDSELCDGCLEPREDY